MSHKKSLLISIGDWFWKYNSYLKIINIKIIMLVLNRDGTVNLDQFFVDDFYWILNIDFGSMF